ncbi:MAG: rubrerythrin family protein [Deltaproteobacteria bacterium]|nr:rubrerythrin family protein [Deltaproteobacteria bacterium]
MNDTTKANLLEAFAVNAAANRRYLAYGRKAQDEGFAGAAKLFRTVARSETIMAANHLKTAGEIRTTAENIRHALVHERESLLSGSGGSISKAGAAHDESARIVLSWSQSAEQSHARFYEVALQALEQGRDCEFGQLHICSACGYLMEGEPPDMCPNCGVGKRLIPAID